MNAEHCAIVAQDLVAAADGDEVVARCDGASQCVVGRSSVGDTASKTTARESPVQHLFAEIFVKRTAPPVSILAANKSYVPPSSVSASVTLQTILSADGRGSPDVRRFSCTIKPKTAIPICLDHI